MLPTNNTRPKGAWNYLEPAAKRRLELREALGTTWNQLFLQQLVDFLLQLAELLFYVIVVVFGHCIYEDGVDEAHADDAAANQ